MPMTEREALKIKAAIEKRLDKAEESIRSAHKRLDVVAQTIDATQRALDGLRRELAARDAKEKLLTACLEELVPGFSAKYGK